MSKSFRINKNLKSFRLDTRPQVFHRAKEQLRQFFLRRFGLWISIFSDIHSIISTKDFNEPHELFDSLRAFFLREYTNINLSVYRYQKTDRSLEFYLGDAYSNTKKIHLKTVPESDYINEREALKTKNFECNISGDWFGGKAAIKIDDFLFSFGARGANFQKNIRDIHAIFSVGLAELIHNKLLLIEEKYTDKRTGLYNSKYVTEVCAKKPFSIVRVDINDFKMINDTHGHAAGDVVLEKLGKIFKDSVRSDDKACRDGWDEFLLLIDSAEIVAIERIISRIQEAIDELNNIHPFPVQISIGYCLYNQERSIDERIKIADEQMYTQKSERSYVYRLAKKISLIQDPESLRELLSHIQQGIPEKILVDDQEINS